MPKEGFSIEDFLARSGASKSSIENYRYSLGQVEGWLGKPLIEATERDLGALKHKLREMPSGKHYVNLMRMFYKAAAHGATVDTDRRQLEDLREICVLKQRLHRLSPGDILSVAEVQRVIDAATTLRDRALIAILWETGSRIHEVLALDLKDIREKTENGDRRVYVIWFRKTKVAGEEHTSYVIEGAPVLHAWLRAHPRKVPDAPLFVSFTGTRLDRYGGFRVVQKAAQKAAVGKRVYPHLFRHSRATHLLRLGMSELQVKRLLGWTPSSAMLARYAHLVDRDAYVGLMKAQGFEIVESVDLGKLHFDEEELRPIVPMNPPPMPSPGVPTSELELLVKDPKVQRFLELAMMIRGIQAEP